MGIWNRDTKDYVQAVVNHIKSFNSLEPIIFVPFIEDKNEDSLILNCPTGTPDGVIADEYDTATAKCPGYTLNTSDALTAKGIDIDEAYAWGNDLWVFGEEENVSSGNMVPGKVNNPSMSNSDRFNGQSEFGGIMQVTNLNALEHWTNGKFEFRYLVWSASGTVIKDREFGKQKRKDFKSLAWKDNNDFIAYWNTANISNWMIEGWIEEDGGNSTSTINQTFPAPCTGCPSTSVSFTKQNRDQDMGRSMVQFTDPISTIYNISYSNFKRKN